MFSQKCCLPPTLGGIFKNSAFHLSMIRGEIQCNIHSSFLSDDAEAYFGLSSSILLMKSGFSRHPSQFSSQSLRIFLRSRTLSFFRSTVLRSICLSEKVKETLKNFSFRLVDVDELTKFQIADLVVFLFKLLTDLISWHRPT